VKTHIFYGAAKWAMEVLVKVAAASDVSGFRTMVDVEYQE